MNNKIIINKIDSKYIIINTAQIMESYVNNMSVVSEKNIIFNATSIELEDIKIDTYLNDKRRKYFPYSEIPIHYRKRLFKEKSLFINTLLEINKPYLIIKSGIPLLYYVTEVNNNFVLIKKILETTNYQKEYVNEEKEKEILKNLVTCEEEEKVFVIDEYGRILKLDISSEEYNKEFYKFIDYLDKNNKEYKFDGRTLDYSSANISLEKTPSIWMLYNTNTYFIKVNKNEIQVKLYKETKVGNNYFKIEICDLKINSLEKILENEIEIQKYLPEPIIKRNLNKKLFNRF